MAEAKCKTPGSSDPAPSRSVALARKLDTIADKPGFLPAVSVFPFLDYALPFLPNQLLLILLSAMRPTRWWAIAAAFTIATIAGAAVTAWLIQSLAGPAIDAVFGVTPGASERSDSGSLTQARELVDRYGVWALSVLALLPTPPRTAVIVCASLGLPPLHIACAVGLGRVVSANAVAFLAARIPGVLRRFNTVDRALRAIEPRRSR